MASLARPINDRNAYLRNCSQKSPSVEMSRFNSFLERVLRLQQMSIAIIRRLLPSRHHVVGKLRRAAVTCYGAACMSSDYGPRVAATPRWRVNHRQVLVGFGLVVLSTAASATSSPPSSSTHPHARRAARPARMRAARCLAVRPEIRDTPIRRTPSRSRRWVRPRRPIRRARARR